MNEFQPEGYGLLVNQITKIMDAINVDDPATALNETRLLIKTFNQEYLDQHPEVKRLSKKIQTLLLDPEKSRYIRLNSRLKQEIETSIEYYDKDIGTDQRLYYQHKIEQEINQTYDDITTFLALIIKDQLTDNI